jgi:hypothetical protein
MNSGGTLVRRQGGLRHTGRNLRKALDGAGHTR